LNVPSAADQVHDSDSGINHLKHLPQLVESSPAAVAPPAISHVPHLDVISVNPARRLSPSDVAKFGQELRDVQGEIASMRRWAAAKRKSDSAVEQEAAARAEDAIALKEQRCEEIRAILKPHEAKIEEVAKAEVAAVSAEQLAEQERLIQTLKDLEAQLQLKNNEIEGLKNFARKKRQSVMPADQQIASKAERAIAERLAEVQALESTAEGIIEKVQDAVEGTVDPVTMQNRTSSPQQNRTSSPQSSRSPPVTSEDRKNALKEKMARLLLTAALKQKLAKKEQELEAESSEAKKTETKLRIASQLGGAAKKHHVQVLEAEVRSIKEASQQEFRSIKEASQQELLGEKARLEAEYEGKLSAERSRFEAERSLFEQARLEAEERADAVKREAEELVERVRADGYEVLQQQRLEFEQHAAEFQEKEQAALKEVERLQTSARMKRKSLAPTDIMEANRLEEQAREIQVLLEEERNAQNVSFEVVKQAAESLKDMVSNEQLQIVTHVEEETTKVDAMKKFVAAKRKSVIPSDQVAAEQANAKVLEKEGHLMELMNTVAQQQSQVDFLMQTIQNLQQNAQNAHVVPGAFDLHPQQLSAAQAEQRSQLEARIEELNEELQSNQEQHAAMMGFYNVKASSSKESEQHAAEAMLSAIQSKTEDIRSIEADIEACEQALQAIGQAPEEEPVQGGDHGRRHSAARSAADRSFEEQQEEVRMLRQKLEEEERAMEKMQKWVSHKRKSVLPADLKAADKAQHELDLAQARVKVLRKSISGKLMQRQAEHDDVQVGSRMKKKGIRFAGDDEDAEPEVNDEIKISDETAEKMRAMEAEIEKLKKWVQNKRASVLPADQQAASHAEQKIKARVAELAKIKEDADKELAELALVKRASLALDKENAEQTLSQVQDQTQESQLKLQTLGKIVNQMKKFAQAKRKSTVAADIEAANQAEAVIASKAAEVAELEAQIAKNLALEEDLRAKAAAADERMKALEDKLADQERRFEDRLLSFSHRQPEVLEPMVALPTDDPEALQRIAKLLHDQSSQLRKSELKKRQSIIPSEQKEADAIARNIAELEKQEARIKDSMSKLRSEQYSDYSASRHSNESTQVQGMRADEAALRAHIDNMRAWMHQKELDQGSANGLDIIRDTLKSKEEELANLQEELLVISGADMGKINQLRQELQLLRNPDLLLQEQEARAQADAEELAQNQEKVRAATLFIATKRRSVFPADHAAADEAENKLKVLQQQVELQRATMEAQQAEMQKVRVLVERMQNPQFGHDEDELIDQGLAEARERTEQEIENIRTEVRQKRKSTFPADIARARELEELLAVKEREQAELENRRQQHQGEVEHEREQARQQAERQQQRIAKLEKMLSGLGESGSGNEADNAELQSRVTALRSEISLMQKWIQSKESTTDASVLQPAREMLQQKMDELQSLQEQLDRPVSFGAPMSLEALQKFPFEMEVESDASVFSIGHAGQQQLLALHDEALLNLSSRPIPISVPGLESALFLSKEALPTKVSELQQLVLDARRMLVEREQKWQGRENAHAQVKKVQAQLLQQLDSVAEKARSYRGDATIAVGRLRERGNYLESRCQRSEVALQEQQAKLEKQRNKVRELMKRLGGQNGRSQQDTVAIEQALSKKEKYKADLAQATSELTDLRDKVVELETNLESSQTEILHARNEQERSVLDFNRLSSDCNQLRSALEGCISHISSHMRRSTSGSLSLTDVMAEMPLHPEENEEWAPITAVASDLLSQTKNILGLIHEASRSSYSAAASSEHASLMRMNQALDSKLKELDSSLAEKDNALKTAETHLAQAVEGLHAMQTASEAAIKHALSSKQREIDALKDKLRNALDNLNTMKTWVVEQHRQLDEEKHTLKLELEEQKRASDAAKQEHEDTTNVLADIIKKKSQELSSMTKKIALHARESCSVPLERAKLSPCCREKGSASERTV